MDIWMKMNTLGSKHGKIHQDVALEMHIEHFDEDLLIEKQWNE